MKKFESFTTKKLFKHGGSYAINLPKEFSKNITTKDIYIEIINNEKKDPELRIFTNNELENIESEPEFEIFIKALTQDALKNPQKLKNLNETWNKFNDLLDGVNIDNE